MTEQDDVTRSDRSSDFDALAEGVVWQDADGRIVDANAAAAPILGLTYEELLGRVSRDPRWYAVREDGSAWPGAEHPGMVALRTGEPQRGQIMGIMVPGQGRRWISIHAMPRFEQGADKPTGVIASFVDVTVQIDLRQRLKEQSEELSELYDKAPCGYHMLDAQGRFTRINDTELKWLGVTREEVLGLRGPRDFLSDESRPVFEESFPRICAGDSLEGIEVELVGVSGQRRWVRLAAMPVLDGEGRFRATRSVLHDISESRLTRMAMERLNAQQQLLLDNELVGIVRIRNRVILWKNRAFSLIFGYDQGELVGQETSVLFPDLSAFESFGEASTKALGEGGTYRATIKLRRKDQTEIWADCSGAVLDASTGEYVWFSKDVTAAKREEALRIEAAALAAANAQLRETARLHSMFLSNMSHELRTPLHAVLGLTAILQRAPADFDHAKRERYLGQIGSSANHLLAMIDSMLELARLESGRVQLQPTLVNPSELVREIVDMLEPKALVHQVTLAADPSSTMQLVSLDPMRLKQVLVNYIGNAIKFSRAQGRVVARASMPAPDRLRIEVEDNGIGISEEDQSRLFVRFQQLSAGNTKSHEGTGIGLALVKQIVEAQGGQVGVRSASGKGSVFWAELPC